MSIIPCVYYNTNIMNVGIYDLINILVYLRYTSHEMHVITWPSASEIHLRMRKTLQSIAVITAVSCENGVRNELKTLLIIYVKQVMKELQYKDNVYYRALLFSMLS